MSEWIKTNDQKPKEGIQVLLYNGMTDFNGDPRYEIGCYREFDNVSLFVSGPYDLGEVKFWMQLPKPPM